MSRLRRVVLGAAFLCVAGIGVFLGTTSAINAERPGAPRSLGSAGAAPGSIPIDPVSSMHGLAMRKRETVDFLLSPPLLVRQIYLHENGGEAPCWPEP